MLAQAQDIVLAPGEQTLCAGTLLDPGGARAYSADQRIVATLCPATPGTQLALAFTWSDIRRGDSLCIYDGGETSSPELTCSTRWTGNRILVQATAANAGGCLTLLWQTDATLQGAGFEATVSCEAVCQPVVPLLASAPDDAARSTVDACPGELVDLRARVHYPQEGLVYDQPVSATRYRWTLPDGRTRTGAQLFTAYTEPGGYTIALDAYDARGCRSAQPHQVQVRIAAPPVFSTVTDLDTQRCAPNTVELTWGAQGDVAATTRTQLFAPTTSRTDSLPLPDGTGAAHESSIFISQFAPGATLQSTDQLVSVCASMEHSWLRDLSVELESPDGRVAVLHDHPGRFGDENFLGEPAEGDEGANTPVPGVAYDYCWDDADPKGDWLSYLNANLDVVTLPAGTYRSYDPLSVFVGAPLNGAWTLRIRDHWESDNGWIFSWDIAFADDLPTAVDSFRTTIVDGAWHRDAAQTAYSPRSIAYAATVAGTLQPCLTLVDDFGCRYDTTLTFDVLPSTSPACGPCAPTHDTLPAQVVALGDTLRFDLRAAGGSAGTYRYVGARAFSHATHPPSRPLRLPLEVESPTVDALGPDAAELLSVCVDLESARGDELTLSLVAPSGEALVLSAYDAAPSWRGRRCFAASVQGDTLAASGAWSALGGANAAGTWELHLADAQGLLDSNVIAGYTLDFGAVASGDIAAPTNVWPHAAGLYAATPLDDGDYTFRYVDAGGCERSLTFPVRVIRPCALTLTLDSQTAPSCAQTPDGQLVVVAVGQQGTVAYTLRGLRSADGRFQHLAAGRHVVVATDSAGCSTRLSVDVSAPDGLSTTHTVEAESCAPLRYTVQTSVSGSAEIVEAGWLDEGSASTDPVSFRQNLTPGSYTFRTLDARGCVVYTPLHLPSLAALEVDALTVAGDCGDPNSGAVELVISGGLPPYQVQWQDGARGTIRDRLSAGTYAGRVVDSLGCENGFAVRLAEPTTLSASVQVEPNWCANEAAGAVAIRVEHGTGPFASRLNDGAWQAGTLLYGLPEGEHRIELRDATDCRWSTEVYVPTLSTLADSLTLSIGDAAYGEPVRVDAAEDKHGAITRTQWRFRGEGDFACDTCVATELTPYSSGLVWAIVEDTLGCRVEGSAQLLLDTELEVLVPTAFTPGQGSADNGRLRVHGRSGTVIERFAVFDRWGTQLYEAGPFAANALSGWDGTYRGEPAPAGTYLYEVTARGPSGPTRRLRGATTLLR